MIFKKQKYESRSTRMEKRKKTGELYPTITVPLKYSQNFIRSKTLVKKVIKKAGIPFDFTILEIGAGKGKITEELIKSFAHVVAIEYDNDLFSLLQKRFGKTKNITLIRTNVMNYTYGGYGNYAIISNIPFAQTAEIVKKVTKSDPLPEHIVLFLQREAAYKFLGKPYANDTLASIILKSRWEGEVIHRCKREDFFPSPKVSVVVIHLKLKHVSIDEQFHDFVAFVYSGWWKDVGHMLKEFMDFAEAKKLAKQFHFTLANTITELDYAAWEGIYKYMLVAHKRDLAVCRGALERLERTQSRLQKINRTRRPKK